MTPFSTSLLRILLIMGLCGSEWAAAGRLNSEDSYNQVWCKKQQGRAEVVLSDRTRVDCLTADGYAVEADFADKYSEGIGQALHYAAVTGLYPGVLLIVEHPERDEKYIQRLYETIRNVCPSVRLWIITPLDLLD